MPHDKPVDNERRMPRFRRRDDYMRQVIERRAIDALPMKISMAGRAAAAARCRFAYGGRLLQAAARREYEGS